MSPRSERKTVPGYTKVKERIPYEGKGATAFLAVVQEILSKSPYLRRIAYDKDDGYIFVEKLVKDEEVITAPVTPNDVVRDREMTELEVTKGVSAHTVIFDAFLEVAKEGLEVSHVFVGDITKLLSWAAVPKKLGLRLFGVPVAVMSELPEDVFLICGSARREAEVEDIEFSVKVVIP